MELTPINFIAHLLHRNESEAKGYQGAARWGTLREDLKSKYRAEAGKMFEEWKHEEEEAEKKRQGIKSHSFKDILNRLTR